MEYLGAWFGGLGGRDGFHLGFMSLWKCELSCYVPSRVRDGKK